MVYPSSSYENDSKAEKPSWAFNVMKGLPGSRLSESYRISYPTPPTETGSTELQYLGARMCIIIVNAFFFAIGLSMIILSIVVVSKPESCELCYAVLRPLLIVGILTAFISIVGLFGAALNSSKLLLLYVTCMTFLLMLQMIVFFWSLFGQYNFRQRLHAMFSNKMRHHPGELTSLLNIVQSKHECCGVDGPLDYHSVGLQVPLTCCRTSATFQCTGGSVVTTSEAPFNTATENATGVTEVANATGSTTFEEAPTGFTPAPALQPIPTVEQSGHYKREAKDPDRNITSKKKSKLTKIPDPLIESEPESIIAANLTAELESSPAGNLSANATTLPPGLFDITNVTGGPELWDVHHVKMRGCYSELWIQMERNRALLAGVTLCTALVIGLQLVIVCCAHRVARGHFLQQA